MPDAKIGLTSAPHPGEGYSINTALPRQSDAFDYLLYRLEATPRDHAAGIMVLILDSTPDWERFRTCIDSMSRRFVRLRQEVVVSSLPTASPRWVVDPHFNLDFHVRRMGVPQPGTLREVLDLTDVRLQSPMDMSRSLWTATLVEGLAEGKAAAFLSCSHALTDGVGTVEMLSLFYELECDPPAEPTPPQPIPDDLPANDLMWAGINRLPGGLRLADLRTAAKAGGGTINEAYVAAISGALGRYHRALGVPIDKLAMTVAVNLRGEANPAAGNRFIIANVAAPVGTADPVTRMKRIRAQIAQRRDEPARSVAHSLAHLVPVLPSGLMAALAGSAQAADLQTSNWPSFPWGTYLASAKVLREHNVGPLPDLPMTAVLISRNGVCTVRVRYDRAAIVEEQMFAQCLLEGFDKILALAGEPAAHAMPASFAAERFDLSTRSASGS